MGESVGVLAEQGEVLEKTLEAPSGEKQRATRVRPKDRVLGSERSRE